jgi:hypothetical protein
VRFAAGVCEEKRGEGGIYRGAGVGEGLGFGASSDRTVAETSVPEPDSDGARGRS